LPREKRVVDEDVAAFSGCRDGPSQQICCIMTSREFRHWLRQRGCTFEPGRGGHLIVRLGRRMSVLPMHGSDRELGTGLVERIKRDLGLK